MWPRKQLDIGWVDLAFGLVQAMVSRRRPPEADVIDPAWLPPDETIITLSVRTGWDLFLAALDLPPGSEIITSGVTIPDMVRIIEEHGLVAVAADVDAASLEVDVDQLERLITPRTRGVLVAHLFGSRMEMRPIIDIAARHDLLVIEDCAQAFVGRQYAGHAETACVMFSFGPIKTATALGGAVLRVRNEAIRTRMRRMQRSYPVQGRFAYLKRLAKYSTFCLLSRPRVYGLAVKMLRAIGKDYDRTLGNAAHSFAPSEFFAQIRRQPCVPLVRMLARRIKTFERRGMARLRRRAARGHELACTLPAGMVVGDENPTHTFWVTPVRVRNQAEVISALRSAGFDATALSSLIVVPSAGQTTASDKPLAAWLQEIVFLPSGDELPNGEWQRQVAILQQVAEGIERPACRELVELQRCP